MAELSPMMKQYFEIKQQNPDTLLFFRLGDFYELFYEDAKIASRELDLTLTGRDCGQDERAPMCGVPFHSHEGYVARLVEKGYKVAICEQMENPAEAKGIVRRDVIRVITPGTVLENSMLEEGRNNFICSVYVDGHTAGLCFADISTGELQATSLHGETEEDLGQQLKNEWGRFAPREILLPPSLLDWTDLCAFLKEKLSASVECLEEEQFSYPACERLVLSQFQKDLDELSLEEAPEIVSALGALLSYLGQTQRTGLERLEHLNRYTAAQFMGLDFHTRRNLELTETMRAKEKKGSLLWVLDKTRTPMGKRLLRVWLERPLLSVAKITRRHDAVEELMTDTMLCEEVAGQLCGIPDMERLMTRIVYGSANGRELRGLYTALQKLPMLLATMSDVQSPYLRDLAQSIDRLEDVSDLIGRAIVDDPPYSIREGGIIRQGFDAALDQMKSDMNNGKALIAQLEAKERERTGIPKLKVGYNRVFGYYVEISNSYKDQAPPEYLRKQTLTSCERFITPELKELEGRILGAQEKSIQLETQLFDQVRRMVAQQLTRIQATASAIAQVDVLVSFGQVSRQYRYTRPVVNLHGRIILKESRHPVVEALQKGVPFVPNDVLLDTGENRVAIITGPNMAGKSTYMRQTALLVLLAQIGCFVPAASAEIGLVDRIFTRVGASDDLAAGQSTFMVEMTEVADILKNATKDSLLILDEIGRGTSTFDGMSIARAVLEYTADPKTLGAKTLFATHYHELTELEDLLDGVKNYNIAVKKHGDDITFLRRIVRGGADDSFGIQVAKLAGVPQAVLERAKQVLRELEQGQPVRTQPKGRAEKPKPEAFPQTTLPAPGEQEVLQRLRDLDVNTLTPIECMNVLFELVKTARAE